MNLPITVTQDDLLEILFNVAPCRPVFIWGAPGIGKSSLVEQFSKEMGLPCVSLLGSQLAPEDIIGIPQIKGDTSEFLPPKMIARKEPYVLFLDELNACSQEVQKAFYSLIHERRIGEYRLPEGSIVVGAGNRAQDSAIVKTMSSALVNRMFHVQMKADARQWIKWARKNYLHPWVIDYIIQRPDHLFSEAPKTEEPFSTPRSWHMLSDAFAEYGAGKREIENNTLKMLAYACLSPSHAGMFLAYTKSLTGDIESHMRELYDIAISNSTISRITDNILPIVKEWQERPLEEVYAVVFMDAIHYHVRSEGRIVKRAVYISLGIDMNGKKDVLGMYVGENESANFWLFIMNGLKNRGVEDILIACVDGLNGFPQAIEAVYPKTEIQQCIIHQIRNSTKFVSYKNIKRLMADLKLVYAAPTEETALNELESFKDKWDSKYPKIYKSWHDNWVTLSTYFKYPEAVRRLIYTTNAIEGFNGQLRKVTKSKTIFPSSL